MRYNRIDKILLLMNLLDKSYDLVLNGFSKKKQEEILNKNRRI